MTTPAAFSALHIAQKPQRQPPDPDTWHCEQDEVRDWDSNSPSAPLNMEGWVEEMWPRASILVPGGNALDRLAGTGGLGVYTADFKGYTDGIGNARVPSPSGPQGIGWARGMDVPDGHPPCCSQNCGVAVASAESPPEEGGLWATTGSSRTYVTDQ